jgi:hypothetical protein
VRLRFQFAHFLADRAGAEVDLGFFDGEADDFDSFEVPGSEAGFFGEAEGVVASDINVT